MRWIVGLVATLFGLIVLTVLVLFAMGLRPGAGHMETTIDIDRPAAEVFAWLSEPEKMKQWVGWLAAVERADPGPLRVGSKETWVMDDPSIKERMRIPAEVIALEENRLLRVRITYPQAFEGTAEYRLEELDGGVTRLHGAADFRYTGFLPRLMEPLITPQAQKKQDADLARLKQRIEMSGGGVGQAQPSSLGRPSASTFGRSCANTRPIVA